MTNQEFINEWNKLTEENDHGRALWLLACHLDHVKYRVILEHINAICDIEGYLPGPLNDYRRAIQVDLFKVARVVMGNEFKGCK